METSRCKSLRKRCAKQKTMGIAGHHLRQGVIVNAIDVMKMHTPCEISIVLTAPAAQTKIADLFDTRNYIYGRVNYEEI